MSGQQRIACCLDDEVAASRALAEGARLARITGGRLEAVHAAEDPLVVDVARLMAHRAPEAPSLEPVLIPDHGDPAAATCAWAAQEGIDVLVAAPHRGTLARLLLGSFASHLASHAPCDVLIARPTRGVATAEPSAPPGPSDHEAPPLEALIEPIEPVRADRTLGEAAGRIDEEGCALPVVDEAGRLVGVIGTAEILTAMLPAYIEQIPRTGLVARDAPALRRRARRALESQIADHMRAPIAVRPGDSESHAASVLVREHLEAVPVVRSWSQLAGVLRASDLVRDLSLEGTPTIPVSSPEDGGEAPEARPFRRIACCVDDSPASLDALATAARLCAAADARLTVVHAVGSPASGEAGSDAQRLLDDAARTFDAGTALIFGHPPTAIARWAAEEGVQLDRGSIPPRACVEDHPRELRAPSGPSRAVLSPAHAPDHRPRPLRIGEGAHGMSLLLDRSTRCMHRPEPAENDHLGRLTRMRCRSHFSAPTAA